MLDSDPYRYRASISDISGQDIHNHGGNPERTILEVRNWLASASRRLHLPGGSEVVGRYKRFENDTPRICEELRLTSAELTFGDKCDVISVWLQADK